MKSTRDALGYKLPIMGSKHPEILCLDADLSKATKTDTFAKAFPERFFQIGIAEANMIGIASGLSEYGYKVVISSFGAFLTGRYDIIRCSLAYSKCPVILVGTHGGLSIGKDGVTQMGLEDVSLMRSMPNMVVLNPSTYTEATKVIEHVCEQKLTIPHYLRLGRQPIEDVSKHHTFEYGKGTLVKDGCDVTIISTGCVLPDVLDATKNIEKRIGISVRVVNIHSIKPIDKDIIIDSAIKTNRIFTVEDHSIIGGLGSAVMETLSEEYPSFVTRIGINDIFPESGPPDQLYEKYGLSANKIEERICNELDK